jgi:hypothetical protein
MSDEPILDSNTRNSILAKVAGLGKRELPVLESRTPGVNVTTSDLTSTAPKKWSTETVVSETKVAETKGDKIYCKNCKHKIWYCDGEWLHSGMLHSDNCECEKPEPKEGTSTSTPVTESKRVVPKQFTSDTPFDQLLEACAESHIAVEEEQNTASDEIRNRVIRECNTTPDFLKDWKF